MFRLVRLAIGTLGAFLRSRPAIVAENLALRHQLGVLLRSKPARLSLTSWDRALWAFVIHRFSGWRHNLVIVRPETATEHMERSSAVAVGSLGIRSVKTAVRAPKMNCDVERLIGTLRPELFDHVIVSSEAHARRLLREFQAWYNEDRVHLALAKDAPDHRPVETPEMGEVVSLPRLGGLHHRYSRRAA